KRIGSKWVLRVNQGLSGKIEKHKAHLVVKGFMQVNRIDYNKIFVSTIKFTILYTILVLAAEMDPEVYQLDMKMAYPNRVPNKEIFIDLPESFKSRNKIV
ncbi:hypothetical protein HETIRDRAFT_319908, partial [Heterobasidion irregulare TC 32-1]